MQKALIIILLLSSNAVHALQCADESMVQTLLAYTSQLKDHCHLDRLSEAQQDVLANLKSLKSARVDKSSFGPSNVIRFENRLKLALENYQQIQNEDSRVDQLKDKIKSAPAQFLDYFLDSVQESSTDVKDTLSLTIDRTCKKAYLKIDKEKQSGRLSRDQIKQLQAEADDICALR